MPRATWDGLPVSSDKPYGATVIVWREVEGEREFLLLHRRAPGGPDFEGEWAWTPPAGARLPGESIDETARRELREETGLELRCRATGPGEEEWAVYVAHASARAGVTSTRSTIASHGCPSRRRLRAALRTSSAQASSVRRRGP